MNANKTSKLSKINKGNLRSFLFFLGLASLFWFLTKFSKEYSQEITTSLNYLNVPDSTVVNEDSNQKVRLTVKASGFDFLFYKLKMPKIPVDLSTLEADNEAGWQLSKDQIETLATQAFKHEVKALVPDSGLRLDLDELGKITVPVISAMEFELDQGFDIVDSLKLTPDSISLIGPKNRLDQISAIRTSSKRIKGVNGSLDGEIDLVLPKDAKQIKMVPQAVNYTLAVDEFVEAELLVPVSLINVPEDTSVQLFPAAIKVKFLVSFKNYKEIEASDFSIVCDLSQIAEDSDILLPQLTKQPEFVREVSLASSQVEFIFIQ